VLISHVSRRRCYQDRWPALNENGLYPNTSNPSVQPIDFSADFHTFSVEWNASSITWSVDGVAYWQRTPAADAAHAQWNAEYLPYSPMYLILNTAVGAESWSGCRCGQLAGEFNSSHRMCAASGPCHRCLSTAALPTTLPAAPTP